MDPLVYQYAVGLIIFTIGLVYAWKQGYVGLSGRNGLTLLFLVGGLAAFFALQTYLQYAPMTSAAPRAFEGNPDLPQRLGTPLDYAVMILYFLAIVALGLYFGRFQKTTKDFFFAGQRFSWWLIAASLVATLVGSYSFVKYSRVAYSYGLSSSQTYLNDWFWMPLFAFGWLPILYFSRITSIPEYFERRFDARVRLCATIIVLIYLVGYVGVNLFTMGTALHSLLGWNVLYAAILVASLSALYVTFGGQSSVIVTDLFQGAMLVFTGLLLLFLGIKHLGGLESFWHNLPRSHRLAFADFNDDPAFSGVGIFWQDAMSNSVMFYFLNQGIIMRFLAARSLGQARKAALLVPLLLFPLAACVVASGGWVARACVNAGLLPEMDPGDAFFIAAQALSRPGVFGLIMAALTAALMSTVDSLVTAVAAVAVNDVYKPYIAPRASERQLLRVARICAVSVMLLGIALVPIFMAFKSIYSAHAAFTAAVTPPLVVTLLLSVFWRRFTRAAALATMIGGMSAIALSFVFPELISPFAHGVPMVEVGDSWLAGFKQYKFMRACYGLSVCAAIGVVVSLFTRPPSTSAFAGLVWGTVAAALRSYKGTAGAEREGPAVTAEVVLDSDAPSSVDGSAWPPVTISAALARDLPAAAGDLLYISDSRWWLGGLYSAHALVSQISNDTDVARIQLQPHLYQRIVTSARRHCHIRVRCLYGA